MKNKNKYIALAVGVVVAIIIFILYTALVSIPREEIASKERLVASEKVAEYLKEKANKENYENCKSTAYREYILDWESACELAGKESDCSLRSYTSNGLDDRLKEKQDTCLSIYKAN